MHRSLIWFRRDLRLHDNPALHHGLALGGTLLPVYIHEPREPPCPGAASDWWLHHSLAALQQALRALGSDLLIACGDSRELIPRIAAQYEADSVFWNRLYEPRRVARDKQVEDALHDAGLTARSFSAALLREPRELTKADGTPYRVFTPFWKALQKAGPARATVDSPERLPAPAALPRQTLTLDQLGLLPDRDWDRGLRASWQPGEAGARRRLQAFFDDHLCGYADDRDRPAREGVSRLSPHLHFGELSPVQIWHQTQAWLNRRAQTDCGAAAEAFLREVAWRDFAHHLLFHFPHTLDEPLDERYHAFPWRTDYAPDLRAWQRGRTGIPMVDAGMRELWATGFMHNRARMLAASLLTKNLLIPWQEGAAWFLDTLVDADLANNTFGWQWTAGCGADAAPYFRIFNPVTQGERFDADGSYVRQWVPELAKLPAKWIHKPWQAPAQVLADAGITLGKHYPQPIVDLDSSRKRALAAWGTVKRQWD